MKDDDSKDDMKGKTSFGERMKQYRKKAGRGKKREKDRKKSR